MKLETHLHSKNGSFCGALSYKELLTKYKSCGYDGIVLTEHFSHHILLSFFKDTIPSKRIERFLNNYKKFEKLAKSYDIKTFFGAEISFYFEDGQYADLLVYGIQDNFFKNISLLDLTLDEFFAYCKSYGAFVSQAHPFRPQVKLMNPSLLDAIEVYNGHPSADNKNLCALEHANKFNIKKMSGSDCHTIDSACRGGIIVPDSISTQSQLIAYLKNNQPELIMPT